MQVNVQGAAFDAMGDNPIARAQEEVAETIRADKWLAERRVEVITQNSKALAFMLKKSIAEVRGVAVIVGVDGFSNNPPVLECTLTVSAMEQVVNNRIAPNSVTAMDAIMRIIQLVDGEDWCMQDMAHEMPAEGVLRATATFKGQVYRHSGGEA